MQKEKTWSYGLTVIFACLFFSPLSFAADFTGNVMAPLAVGDVRNPDHLSEADAWKEFDQHLDEAKKMGVTAVTTDVWWGVVEPQAGNFHWEYYDKLAKSIRAKKLKWIPILSTHQCGGNVGDECFFSIPKWIWTKHIGQPGITSADSLKYKSEYGHTSDEVVSVWGTQTVLADYERFYSEFQKHFAGYAKDISEINISLGASGELRYPSFNSHDPKAGYPSRGALQSYSDLALESFRKAMRTKYQTLDKLNKSWGFSLANWNLIYPPSDLGPPDAGNGFYQRGEHFTAYGKDFFDWYQQSLLDHGEKLLNTAVDVFNTASAPFRGIDIGAKFPGVHWRSASDRLAELASGMIRTSGPSWGDGSTGHGYSQLIGMFKNVSKRAGSPAILVHYTCLEKDNYEDGDWAKSMAKALVFWVGAEAKRQGVVIKGENALAGPLYADKAWDNILNALTWSHYSGITILRLKQVVDSPVANRRFREIIQKFAP